MALGLAERLEALPAAAGGAADCLPHVVAWNLTRRCNLACVHCYIAAGPEETARGELDQAAFRRIASEILAVNPAPVFILSGGEPLLREDLVDLVRFAAGAGATVVLGTNGTLLTDQRIEELAGAGLSGVAVSVDSLEPALHDRFRHGTGSLAAVTAALERLRRHQVDFVIQTTVTKASRRELGRLVAWAADQGAVCFNAYFLVPAGRGRALADLSPQQYEEVLRELVGYHRAYLGRMMVRAKCAPHFMRLVYQETPESPVLHYRTRCPCGVHYCRVTPDGKLTPCPYLPLVAGDLRRQSFAAVWHEAPLFGALRSARLGGRCGRCEFRELCGGCRARALATSGDYLAEDPSCAYQPSGAVPAIQPPRAATYGMPAAPELPWTPEAAERLRRIPSFVRGVVVQRVEAYARRQRAPVVTLALLREVRAAMPVDFSRRLPFFARDGD